MIKSGISEFRRLTHAFSRPKLANGAPAREGPLVTRTELAIATRVLAKAHVSSIRRGDEMAWAHFQWVFTQDAMQASVGYRISPLPLRDDAPIVQNGHELRALILGDPERHAAIVRSLRKRANVHPEHQVRLVGFERTDNRWKAPFTVEAEIVSRGRTLRKVRVDVDGNGRTVR